MPSMLSGLAGLLLLAVVVGACAPSLLLLVRLLSAATRPPQGSEGGPYGPPPSGSQVRTTLPPPRGVLPMWWRDASGVWFPWVWIDGALYPWPHHWVLPGYRKNPWPKEH